MSMLYLNRGVKNMESKLNKMIAKRNIILIPIIFLLIMIISIIAVVNSDELLEKEKENYIDILQIENIESNVNSLVKLKVTKVDCLVIQGNNVGFYIVSDGEKEYVIDILNYNYQEMISDIEEQGYYDMYGVTCIPTEQFKNYVVNAYNEQNPDNQIKLGDYNDKFGVLFISQNRNIYSYVKLSSLALFICGIFEILLVSIFLGFLINTLKTRKKLTSEEMKEMREQTNKESAIIYNKNNIILTDSYIIDLTKGMIAIKYSDIIWAYPYDYNRLNFIKELTIYAKENNKINKYKIGTTKKIGKNIELGFANIYKKIAERSQNALLGNTSENKNEFMNKYRIKE